MAENSFARYRVGPGSRSYSVDVLDGVECPFRVSFFVDGVGCGFGQFHTADQADDAGAEFMFSGWGDGSEA